jgi:2-C-methyl-D-erythritol 4-phosphate cytidylyltransferase
MGFQIHLQLKTLILKSLKINSSFIYKIHRERKTLVSGGDRRELSVCSIHSQSDAHRTKVWEYRSTPPFRE